MPRAQHACTWTGCSALVPAGTGRCEVHRKQAERQRGSSASRGYGHRHRTRFRSAVLARDPICTLCHRAPSTDADHYPRSRRELVASGENPNDPRHGRGLCHPCHSAATSQHQPGGWAHR